MRKMRKVCTIVGHAFQMVGRTWKSYALLSVTIMLSFSLLLGYLTFSDSAIYNEYKALFSYRRQDLRCVIYDNDVQKVQLLVDKLSAMENTAYYLVYNYRLGYLSTRFQVRPDPNVESERDLHGYVNAYMLPDHSWPEDVQTFFFTGQRMDIVWMDGQEHQDFALEKDEVILTEGLYQMLQLDREEEPIFHLNLRYGQKIPLQVVGYVRDYTSQMWQAEQKESLWPTDSNLLTLFLSNKFIDYAQLDNEDYYGTGGYTSSHIPKLKALHLQVYSEKPETVANLLESMELRYDCVYQMQNQALDEICPQKQIKAIITCALLLLLGINLYSSFANALNDRKYEIGVKRALGASGFSIVRQFLYESIIVMAANILVSIALVADVAIVYKYVAEHTQDEFAAYPDFVLYISPWSVAMFGVCAVALTVVFSLIFAYKSTQVEIVRYLKAE